MIKNKTEVRCDVCGKTIVLDLLVGIDNVIDALSKHGWSVNKELVVTCDECLKLENYLKSHGEGTI